MKKIFIVIIITALDILCIVFFVVPAYDKSAALENQVVQAQNQYETKAAYYAGISQMIAQIDKRQTSFLKVDDALSSFSSAGLINFLQGTSLQTGITIEGVTFAPRAASPKATAKTVGLQETSFDIAVSGSYGQLKSFLNALEKSGHLFEVDTIDFSSLNGSGGAQKYDFKLKVKTHYYQ